MSNLRVWPGVVLAMLVLLLRFVVPAVLPEAIAVGILGGLAGGLAVLIWWVFFSRAPRAERWGGGGLMVAAILVTKPFIDRSIATGMQGLMFFLYAAPLLGVAFVLWAVASRRLPGAARWATMLATIGVACGFWLLVRTNGMTGNASSDFAWRWTPTKEEQLVARVPVAMITPVALTPVVAAPLLVETPKVELEWPGFRGARRDSVITGVRIRTDWAAAPPVQIWRRPVGPGWSSFAVRGGRLYTQEQRGEDELVSCYSMIHGEPVWEHRDAARFWESNGGAGPRGTPTLSGNRVYTFGATGILNALDAVSGAVIWTRHAASDTGTKTPGWGFASSPLVLGDTVIVATSGQLAAYDAATGTPRWKGPAAAGGSYSSPQLFTLAGVPQIVLLNATGASGVSVNEGKQLWNYAWPPNWRIVQPALTPDGDLLIDGGESTALRRIAVTHQPAGEWKTEERWTSTGLKPYFNDFVFHQGHVYGFDNGILACLDASDGKRKWKGGRYGHGQFLLLRDQDVLLVLSEEGELALVKATPDQFTELARFTALEGKTWNHPVLVGNRLLVRNGSEMVAFQLAR